MPRRVVVTGVGVVSALGPDRSSFWESLCGGRSGIVPIPDLDCSSLAFSNGAVVRGFDPGAHFERRQLKTMDRFAQFAVVAAREAVADAGLERGEAWDRTAVVTGSCLGGQATQEAALIEVFVQGRRVGSPLVIPRVMANSGASQVSMEMGARGPAYTVSSACSSANHAIGQALWMVRSGVCDRALAGGSEAPFCLAHLKAWDAMRVVSPDTCRPFSRDRQGMILGEGGAILVLEPLEAARARGARIYAELAGAGMSADAHQLTQPSEEGAALALEAALHDGSLRPEEVGYVNAHGTGTPLNDSLEVRVIRAVLGDRVAVSSTKSMHGHALGAAGALEAAATILALHHGILPPTANHREPDSECDLDVIPNEARERQVEAALSSSFAFGGLNAVLAFRRWKG